MKKITNAQFISAAETGNIFIVQQYIQEGSNINVQEKNGWTALICAA
jgi:ankyrin repeat protein